MNLNIKFYLAIIFAMISIICFILAVSFMWYSYHIFCKELDKADEPACFEVDDQGNKLSDFIGNR